MSNLKGCYDLLNENEPSVYKEVSDILLRLCRNVMKNPTDLKYRTVRFSNAIVANKILPAIGAMECLFEIGFVEQDDHLLLPENASLVNLRELHNMLLEPRTTKAEVISSAKSTGPIHPAAAPASQPKLSTPQAKPSISQAKPSTSQFIPIPMKHDSKFFNQIRGHLQDVLRYENPALLSRARAVVPVIELEVRAMEKMRLLQREAKSSGDAKSGEINLSMEDLMLVELLAWFKEDFFEWVDSPKCTRCSGNCTFHSIAAFQNPGISRTEIHRCGTCGTSVEFPRYSDPGILLNSRKGRCGEWANAFGLICRALGYDTRLVWDYTDHVWVETWSIAANRWIHADPCENAMDRPLLYEKGWGKKLSYILAFSKDEIQDVTWRYTADQRAVMKRRNLCSEQDLLSIITSLTQHMRQQPHCSAARREYLVKRSVMELVELIACQFGDKNKDQDEYQGRTSGSLSWRLARQETKVNSPHVWRVPESVNSYRLRYLVKDDVYIASNVNGDILEEKKGWNNGAYEANGGIFRKVETDWKMVYLARSPDSATGEIEWQIEVANSNFEIRHLNLRAITAVFQQASVQWRLQGFYRNGKTKIVDMSDATSFQTDQLSGAFKISLTTTLSGGDKDSAWQHAQLFRQSLDANQHSMEITIQLGRIIG